MGDWDSHNRAVAKASVEEYLKKVKANIVAKLREVAKMMVDWIDGKFEPIPPYTPGGNDNFPVWFGDMHDATGVGLYVDGRTEYFMPWVSRIAPQSSTNYNGEIWGHEMLQQAITNTASKFPKGIWIILFSAVPYAEKVNVFGSPLGRGIRFFDKSTQELTALILSQMQPMSI